MMLKRRQQGRLMTEEEELRRAFALFDIDGDGVITAEELRTVMHNLGSDLTSEEVELLIREADYDGDNTISLAEFATFMVRWGGLRAPCPPTPGRPPPPPPPHGRTPTPPPPSAPPPPARPLD